MEMHTRESLRRIHGVEAQPAGRRRQAHKMSISECHAMAGRLRGELYRRIFSRAASSLVRFARERVLEPIRRRHRIRRDSAILNRLSDRQPRDIGLTRSDIGHAVRYGRLTEN